MVAGDLMLWLCCDCRKKVHFPYNFRYRLVLLSQNISGIDARILLRPNWRGGTEYLDPPYSWVPKGLGTKSRSAPDTLKRFKYVLNVDGNAAAWRMYYQVSRNFLDLNLNFEF